MVEGTTLLTWQGVKPFGGSNPLLSAIPGRPSSRQGYGGCLSMNHQEAEQLIRIYGEAWMERDVEKILHVFTSDATYFDPREGTQVGHEGIRNYWNFKVLNNQKDIHFTLLHIWIDGDTVIAEWNATFIDISRSLHIDMTEVAIFGVRDNKFSSLREYYTNIKTPL